MRRSASISFTFNKHAQRQKLISGIRSSGSDLHLRKTTYGYGLVYPIRNRIELNRYSLSVRPSPHILHKRLTSRSFRYISKIHELVQNKLRVCMHLQITLPYSYCAYLSSLTFYRTFLNQQVLNYTDPSKLHNSLAIEARYGIIMSRS